MFSLFQGASLKIAKNLIKVTGVQEGLGLFLKMNLSNVNPQELYIQMLSLNATNLLQTMKEDFIRKEIDSEDCQDIVDDYVVENLRHQKFIFVRDGAELMDKCQEIEGIAQKFRIHWMGEGEQTGPEPRYFCVMDVLRKLGNEKNHYLQDALYDFINHQHQHFTRYFQILLSPIEGSEAKPAREPALEVPVVTNFSEPAISVQVSTVVHPEETFPARKASPGQMEKMAGPAAEDPVNPKAHDMSWVERLFYPNSGTQVPAKPVQATEKSPALTGSQTSPASKVSPDQNTSDLPRMEKPFHL